MGEIWYFVFGPRSLESIRVSSLELIDRLSVDGKFFHTGEDRVFLKMVTYGPFPDPRPVQLGSDREEFEKMAAAGLNAIRIYEMPSLELLDAADACGLWVFSGLCWRWGSDYMAKPSDFSAAKLELSQNLSAHGKHRAWAGVFVANEIPADLVRWMGVVKVRESLEDLIREGRLACSTMLFAYSNFPTTEYLEPDNADFTAMNVYLEQRAQLAAYLPRLHNVAGDRPVLLSEIGLDSLSHGEERQQEVLEWSLREALQVGMAGLTIFAWSDWWFSGGRVVDDWSFGLNGRNGEAKPALIGLSKAMSAVNQPEDGVTHEQWPMFSVVICTYRGAERMGACLEAVCQMNYPKYEVIVVDDGSEDHLEEVVGQYPEVRLVKIKHGGLSAARNKGAAEAKGEFLAYTDDDCQPDAAWLFWLADAFMKKGWDACGGPNLAPLPSDIDEAVVASAPGAPSHVLLSDCEAEHLPGCNLAVRKSVMEHVGGYRDIYKVAGDDVDFCWRLRERGYRLGFCGAAFVWHRRRTTLWRYFKQQLGYGKAEALLMRDHPECFHRTGGARWQGRVYTGEALFAERGDTIYHGSMGTAGYQQLAITMQPRRALAWGFDSHTAKFKLGLAMELQPLIRKWSRYWHSRRWRSRIPKEEKGKEYVMVDRLKRVNDYEARWWKEGFELTRLDVLQALCQNGWVEILDHSDWDLSQGELRLLVAREEGSSGSVIMTRIEMSEKTHGKIPANIIQVMAELELKRLE